MPTNELTANKIHIQGIVQGVGFRPFIYSLAHQYHLTGWVRNSSAGVDIVVNGPDEDLAAFIDAIRVNAPPLSQIDSLEVQTIAPDGFTAFTIVESKAEAGGFIPISPDISICDDCRSELFDPNDRRYRYPFINCTNCGPRFTIIKDIPYDRPLTTMADFPLCEDCATEYADPLDRRFHAQPVACSECGPQVWFQTAEGRAAEGEDAIQMARSYLKAGKIVALKGLGGFHLACDASNPNAIAELRRRKRRSLKSFAVMVWDSAVAEKYCHVTAAEKALLESKERPIVILQRRPQADLPANIAPNLRTLGVMLPYTPLHYLLLESEVGYPDVFVMTSGNISEEPIAYTNQSALNELADIADGYLLNDRGIETRLDDSVLAEFRSRPYFFRRSRGYAPHPLKSAQRLREVLAVGAELKNTFCLTKDHYAFLSHHIGDLENLETLHAFESGIPHYEHIFKVQPRAIVRDLHPDYLSSQYAQARAEREGLPIINVQHHHAHLAACLADNQYAVHEAVIGAIFDGTGLGTDSRIWGGEWLSGDFAGFERRLHLAYYPLPGGDSAVRQPKRLAAAYLYQAGIPWSEDLAPIRALSPEERSVLAAQLENDLNCPRTSSMGRLFDAVASLIGVCQEINYEAQAAIELENLRDPQAAGDYPFTLNGVTLDFAPLLQAIVDDLRASVQPAVISAKFHHSVVKMLLAGCEAIRHESGLSSVALSGGVWQNMALLNEAVPALEAAGFTVLFHQNLPPNDGCIALGQAFIANRQLELLER
ncbi:MAG: hydrogenase maturation protein HypF [Chloroflexota bacterium]|nr:hydrogenase maturation protein HypF [Chloroflexota bacterium]